MRPGPSLPRTDHRGGRETPRGMYRGGDRGGVLRCVWPCYGVYAIDWSLPNSRPSAALQNDKSDDWRSDPKADGEPHSARYVPCTKAISASAPFATLAQSVPGYNECPSQRECPCQSSNSRE